VGPQGVVGAAEQAEFDSEGVAIADDRAVEVLVFQGAEEPFDHAVRVRLRLRLMAPLGSELFV
jgi:hypothetical protein